MGGSIVIMAMGEKGVNVDKNPFELDDSELQRASNAVSDLQSGVSTIAKRPGLVAHNLTTLASDVIGGSPLPGPNLSSGGVVTLYIGRAPIS